MSERASGGHWDIRDVRQIGPVVTRQIGGPGVERAYRWRAISEGFVFYGAAEAEVRAQAAMVALGGYAESWRFERVPEDEQRRLLRERGVSRDARLRRLWLQLRRR